METKSQIVAKMTEVTPVDDTFGILIFNTLGGESNKLFFKLLLVAL